MSGLELNLDLILKLTSPLRVEGTYEDSIKRIASLTEAQTGDVSFLANKKYRKDVADSRASVIFLPEDYEGTSREGQLFLYHGSPSRAVDLIAEVLQRQLSPKPIPGVHPTASIHPSVTIPLSVHVGALAVLEAGAILGDGCSIGAQSYVGRSVRIGPSTTLKPRSMVLDYCRIGSDCLIHSGAVIGSDGFGYETVDGEHLRSPQIGIVVLEDHVDVGANSTIDRARFSETRIGQGTKVDNLVQIAHNVIIGKGCFLASQVGIAGSTHIGNFVLFGGKSGASGHLTIGDFCQIGGSTAVYQNLPPKSFVSGYPAMPYYLAQKFNVLRKKLPELFHRVDKLENHPPTNP